MAGLVLVNPRIIVRGHDGGGSEASPKQPTNR